MGKNNRRIVFLIIALVILTVFVALQFVNKESFVCWRAQFSVFYRNYQNYGRGFFPAYNYKLTSPPSDPYLSAGPLVTWLAYIAAMSFGDVPATYMMVMTAVHVLFFSTLALFVARRWGARAGLWALLFAALSKYALRYGDVQTFEHMSVIGVFVTIFLYFEWLDKSETRFWVYAVLAYLLGLTAHYLAFFGALIVCLHWLFFARERNRRALLKMAAFPLVTLVFVGLMYLLLAASGYGVEAVLARAGTRFSASTWGDLIVALFKAPFILLGPGLMLAALGYLVFRQIVHWRGGEQFGTARLELDLLYCLLLAGLLPMVIFKNFYVVHGYAVMFSIPFLVTGASAAVEALLAARLAAWQKYGLLAVVVLGFLGPSLQQGWKILQPDELTDGERITALVESVDSEISSDDTMLILNDVDSEEPRICVTYAGPVPNSYAFPPNWETALSGETATVILTTSEEAARLVGRQEAVEVLARDEELIIFTR